MNSGGYLKELLRPLGVYRLEGSFLGAELESLGAGLDGAQECLEEIQREMCLATAQDRGLEMWARLFVRRPAADTVQRMRDALAALGRIGGDSFTLAAINDTIRGCGLNAVVTETDTPGTVEVRFPEVAGIPEGFERMQPIIEDILPAHLLIEYVYWYQTWAQLEARGLTWAALEAEQVTWRELETMVE